MRVAVLSAVLFACCDGRASAVGTYELDKEALAKMLQDASKGVGGAMLQKVAESAGGSLELRADGSATMQLTLGVSSRSTGTWKLDSQGILLTLVDGAGKQQQLGCGYDGRSIAIAEQGPGGIKLQLVWHRK